MKKKLCILLIIISILFISTIILIQPWSDITVNSTHSSSSSNNISTYITITANRFTINDIEDFTEHLLNLYETNSLPEIMLSDDHYTKESSITFIIHTNRLTKLLGFEYLTIDI